MTAAWAAASAALLLAVAARGADPVLCRAEAALEPGDAVVGQQVLYRVRILSRDDVQHVEWLEPPSFPEFRAERLPGAPQPSRTESGRRYRLREEQRALFPERAGELIVVGASLRCVAPDGSEAAARVPPASLHVRALPAAGGSASAGLVGPLALHVSAEPKQMRLGESLRLEISLRGAGNLWQARDPFPDDAAFGGAELFRFRPRLSLEPGTRLLVKRDFAYDVVPRSAGVLSIPPIQVDYFDPVAGRHRRATAPGFEVAVAAVDAAATPPAATPADEARATESGGRGRAGLLSAAVLALAGLGLAIARRRRRRPDPALELAEADRARDAGDAEAELTALARVLREALARRLPDARGTDPASLATRRDLPAELADAVRVLASLERARFDPSATPPARDAVERALARL